MMNHFLALLFAASCLTAVGQVPDYVPIDGLLGWWPLDGNGENAMTDGLDFELTNVNSSEGNDGDPGTAISFNGESSIGQINENLGLVGEFSLSIWIRSDLGIFNYNPLFHIGDAQTCENEASQLEAYVGNGGLTVVTNRTSPQSSDHYFSAFTYNTWTHLGLRLSDGVMTMFLDGEPFETWPFEALNEASFDAFLGFGQWIDSQCVTSYYEGEMDNLGLWNRALSDCEMATVQAEGSLGCTDPSACNYNPAATADAGNCVSCEFIASFCGPGTTWDSETQTCIVANPADTNLDGCVQLNDLLDLLGAYGDCGAEESAWQCGDPLEYQGYDYETVQIGTQCWFAENLRSENYGNGDTIPAGLSDGEWSTTISGAVAVYGENAGCDSYSPDIDACDPAQSLNEYGRLYNWYAVDDVRSLCPSGWHVPTDEEWTVMTDHLGGEWIAGGHMKTIYGWSGGGNGTNASGFSGFPGGYRYNNGHFNDVGNSGLWWSSSPVGSHAWYRVLDYSNEFVYRSHLLNLRDGFSVRCIKDVE